MNKGHPANRNTKAITRIVLFMMRPPLLFCLVLKRPDVGDETMCFEAWEFQTLTHKDRTAKSAIFPFQARKVKKDTRPELHTRSTLLPRERPDPSA